MRCSTLTAFLVLAGLPGRSAPARPPVVSLALEEAEAQVLERFDAGEGLQLPAGLAAKHRPAVQWLVAVAASAQPANPFRAGTSFHREAEAFKALQACPSPRRAEALAALSLKLTGTRLGLWRWGKALSRARELPPSLRVAWEDRLLGQDSPALLVDYALRHALCFALAEGDEARLGSLKQRFAADFPELFQGWQRLFGLLGSGTPAFRFWALPGQQAVDGPLATQGRRLWIQPAEGNDLPRIPAGTTWIIPARAALQPDDREYLEGPDAEEASRLEARLRAASLKALFAPSRHIMEKHGLVYFPILLELDGEGRLLRVLMGDAAPVAP